ncbi:hypothetical protein EZY14_009340 [Kordia sp. TARA_039_SRF]|nr:hypothetical protein EZY14_009340 [Kordia sp. TARA_039_SRF]
MKQIAEFKRLLHDKMNSKVPKSVVWGVVEKVDWDNKTMDVKSIVDELPYEDVILGLNSIYRKPKIGSKCLIGIIGGNQAVTYLIEAEEIEEINYNVGNTEFNISEDGILLKRNEELMTVLSDMIDEINKIIVIKGRSIDVAAMVNIKNRFKNILR